MQRRPALHGQAILTGGSSEQTRECAFVSKTLKQNGLLPRSAETSPFLGRPNRNNGSGRSLVCADPRRGRHWNGAPAPLPLVGAAIPPLRGSAQTKLRPEPLFLFGRPRNGEVSADRSKSPFRFSILETKAHSLVCSLDPPVNIACPCNAGRLCTQLI